MPAPGSVKYTLFASTATRKGVIKPAPTVEQVLTQPVPALSHIRMVPLPLSAQMTCTPSGWTAMPAGAFSGEPEASVVGLPPQPPMAHIITVFPGLVVQNTAVAPTAMPAGPTWPEARVIVVPMQSLTAHCITLPGLFPLIQ